MRSDEDMIDRSYVRVFVHKLAWWFESLLKLTIVKSKRTEGVRQVCLFFAYDTPVDLRYASRGY